MGELCEIYRGLTYEPTSINLNGIRVLRSSNIDEDRFIIGDDDIFVDAKVINVPFAENGDILITSANGSSRLVGKHTIIRGIKAKSAVHGGFMLLIKSKKSEFLNASMSSKWYMEFINTFVSGGNGSIGNLKKSDLEKQKIYVPSTKEKNKIGIYFNNLDYLITLHQRLYFTRFLDIFYKIIDF